MSDLGPTEVARLARLARLDLSPDESAALAPQLAAIAHEFERLRDLAAALPPPADPEGRAPRDDAIEPFPDRDAILAQVPKLDGGGRVQVGR